MKYCFIKQMTISKYVSGKKRRTSVAMLAYVEEANVCIIIACALWYKSFSTCNTNYLHVNYVVGPSAIITLDCSSILDKLALVLLPNTFINRRDYSKYHTGALAVSVVKHYLIIYTVISLQGSLIIDGIFHFPY